MIPRKYLLAQVFRSAPARQYYSLRNPPKPVNLKIDRARFTASIDEVARLKQQNTVTYVLAKFRLATLLTLP
jgi:hypothetical protein